MAQPIVEDVRITRVTLPRRDTNWRTSSYARSAVEGFAIEVHAGGHVGIGGTAAHPSRISGDELEAELRGPVREALLGANALEGNLVRERVRASGVSARTALAADLVLWDLLGKMAGMPCHVLWGGAVRQSLDVVRMVGIKSPPDLVTAVQELVDDGFTHFKVKIGTSLAEDVERVQVLRDTFGSRLHLAVDGNGAYSADDAIALSRALEPFDISLIEQPVDDADLDGLARVTAASNIPIMADQVVEDLPGAIEVCRRRLAHVVSIKATKMASIASCQQVAAVCLAAGIRVHVGGSAGPAVVDAAQIQMAASIPGVDAECEVGEFMAVANDITSGVVIRDGRARLSDAPGLGITLAVPAAATLV